MSFSDSARFRESVLKPFRFDRGKGLREWIESEAERYSRLGRRGCRIELNSRLREALRITDVHRPEYSRVPHARSDGQDRQTASILLTDAGHQVSVLRVGGSADIRALEAHEFGHALLFSDQRVWKLVSRRGLLVDPTAERLADDAGRALVLPRSLLLEALSLPLDCETPPKEADELWAQLPRISRLTVLPHRLVASRMAPLLVDNEAVLTCYTLPRQGGLFEPSFFTEQGLARVPADVRWIMHYSWLCTADYGKEYLFADSIGASRRVLLEDELLSVADANELTEVPSLEVRQIVGEDNWSRLSHLQSFRRVALSAFDDHRRHFILGT